jgi:sortase A
MKKRLPVILLILAFLLGMSLLIYPLFSDYWNQQHQTKAITEYSEQVENLTSEEYQEMWAAAKAFNEKLAKELTHFELSEEEQAEYDSLLNLSDSGIMGYIQIPSIDCELPIYHGTDETVLQSGVGHLEGSSLPTGGESTHCVLSGHRGLPSSTLFTNLNQLVEGDLFILQIMDETLTYEVDQILIVDPDQTDALAITEGEDYCTLLTCTPYGINTHRLLVRGHRVENEAVAKRSRIDNEAVQIDTMLVASLVAVPLLILVLIGMLATTRRRKKGGE